MFWFEHGKTAEDGFKTPGPGKISHPRIPFSRADFAVRLTFIFRAKGSNRRPCQTHDIRSRIRSGDQHCNGVIQTIWKLLDRRFVRLLYKPVDDGLFVSGDENFGEIAAAGEADPELAGCHQRNHEHDCLDLHQCAN